MARRTPKNAKLVAIDLDLQLIEELNEFTAKRGESKRTVVTQALRRHMAKPPKSKNDAKRTQQADSLV